MPHARFLSGGRPLRLCSGTEGALESQRKRAKSGETSKKKSARTPEHLKNLHSIALGTKNQKITHPHGLARPLRYLSEGRSVLVYAVLSTGTTAIVVLLIHVFLIGFGPFWFYLFGSLPFADMAPTGERAGERFAFNPSKWSSSR